MRPNDGMVDTGGETAELARADGVLLPFDLDH
jgi:hypothetical protein